MNQSELRELFDFCENTFKGFKVENADESDHFYLNDVCIGGYAGDRQELFFEHSDELASAIQMMDIQKKISDNKIKSEKAEIERTTEKEIKLDLNVVDGKIESVSSNKYLGYIDGPDEPIYDLYNLKNLDDLYECLVDISDQGVDFPENASFYIEGCKFAESKGFGNVTKSNDFPDHLEEKLGIDVGTVINLDIETKKSISGRVIDSVNSDKMIAKDDFDGSEIKDVSGVHSLTTLHSNLQSMLQSCENFSDDTTFNIDGHKFAKVNKDHKEYLDLNPNFPLDVVEKYATARKEVFKTLENDDGTFSILKDGNTKAYYGTFEDGSDTLLRTDTDISSFNTKSASVKALNDYMKGSRLQRTSLVDSSDITLVYLDEKPFGGYNKNVKVYEPEQLENIYKKVNSLFNPIKNNNNIKNK